MIPKVIHYCWFGHNEKPKLAQRCIASWRKYCSDFRIIEWNEDNFDVAQHPYLQWCYDQKKWAFLSDYARLLILRDHGGIYLDTDVEVIRPLDDLLLFDAFFGFEENRFINTGQGFGCATGHPAVTAMTKDYEDMKPDPNGSYITESCPLINTRALLPYGLQQNGQRQTVLGAEILPADYLNPYDDPTGRLNITENTYSIHWYAKSWISKQIQIRSQIMKPLHRIFGTNFILFKWLRKK